VHRNRLYRTSRLATKIPILKRQAWNRATRRTADRTNTREPDRERDSLYMALQCDSSTNIVDVKQIQTKNTMPFTCRQSQSAWSASSNLGTGLSGRGGNFHGFGLTRNLSSCSLSYFSITICNLGSAVSLNSCAK